MAKVDYSGRMALVYEAGRHLSDESLHTWMDAAARYVGATDGPVLDLGSGTGRFSAALAGRFAMPVIALEPAAGMRTQAARTEGSLASVRMVAGRAEALPFASRSFTAVWASQVLHHVHDLDRCAAELRRVLKRAAPSWSEGCSPRLHRRSRGSDTFPAR